MYLSEKGLRLCILNIFLIFNAAPLMGEMILSLSRRSKTENQYQILFMCYHQLDYLSEFT